jgi:cell division protein FtsB
MIKLYALLFLVSIMGGCAYYYKDTQSRLELLTTSLAVAETAAKANELVIEQMKATSVATKQNIKALEEDLKVATVYKNELIQKLRRHNLTVLTMQKPGLIERRVNDASKKILEDLQTITAD